MNVGRRVDYAVRALSFLAGQPAGKIVSRSDIEKSQDIPSFYLSKIMKDLVAGAKRVVVMMTHATREGEPKILRRCLLPLTGARVVDRIITDLAVIDVEKEGLVLREIAPHATVESVVAATGARLVLDPGGVPPMRVL